MEIKISPEDRIAPTPKQSNKGFIIALVAVCLLFGGAGYKFYMNDLKEQELKALRERLAQEVAAEEAKKEAQRAAAKPKTLHYDEVTSPFLEELKNERRQKADRQTVFNDQNYTPRGATNILPSKPVTTAPPSQSRTQPRNTVKTKWAEWRWQSYQSGSKGKQLTNRGRFSYTVQNGQIDNSSVCGNETRGSIRYRDCRKGAKAYFTDRCKSGNREACTGANMTP